MVCQLTGYFKDKISIELKIHYAVQICLAYLGIHCYCCSAV